MPPITPAERLYELNEIAMKTGRSVQAIKRELRLGRIGYITLGRRRVVPERELCQYLMRSYTPAAPATLETTP